MAVSQCRVGVVLTHPCGGSGQVPPVTHLAPVSSGMPRAPMTPSQPRVFSRSQVLPSTRGFVTAEETAAHASQHHRGFVITEGLEGTPVNDEVEVGEVQVDHLVMGVQTNLLCALKIPAAIHSSGPVQITVAEQPLSAILT